MRCSFSFGQIEELLALAHRIDPAKRTAFQGRLKHLQRWEFPTGEKPGKGKAIRYSVEHLYMMVLALELIQSGMPPKLSADLVRDNWRELCVTTYLNLYSDQERKRLGGDEADDWCWLFRPEALREISVEGFSEYDHHEAVLTVEASQLGKYIANQGEAFGGIMGASWRTLVINGGPLVRGVANLIELRFHWATIADMRADLLEANEDSARKLQEALESFRDECGDWTPSPKKSVAERYPRLIVDAAQEALASNRALLAKIDVPDGTGVELTKTDLEELQSAGVLRIEAEGILLTEKGVLIQELISEERAACGNSQT